MATNKTKDRWMTIRIPPDVELALRRQAEADTRTLAAQVLHYIKQGLAERRSKRWSRSSLQTMLGASGIEPMAPASDDLAIPIIWQEEGAE